MKKRSRDVVLMKDLAPRKGIHGGAGKQVFGASPAGDAGNRPPDAPAPAAQAVPKARKRARKRSSR